MNDQLNNPRSIATAAQSQQRGQHANGQARTRRTGFGSWLGRLWRRMWWPWARSPQSTGYGWMMFATIPLGWELFEPERSRWFVPLLNCYQIANATISIGGGPTQQPGDFRIDAPYVYWLDSSIPIAQQDYVSLDLRYTPLAPEAWRPALAFADAVIATNPSLSTDGNGLNDEENADRAEVFLRSYLNAQRDLDGANLIGALVNFGTAVEAVLHNNLQHQATLGQLLRNTTVPKVLALRPRLSQVAEHRNHVHARQAALRHLSVMREGQDARAAVEMLLKSLLT